MLDWMIENHGRILDEGSRGFAISFWTKNSNVIVCSSASPTPRQAIAAAMAEEAK